MISMTPILQVASDTHAEDISSNLTSCQAATTAISEDLEVVRGGLNQGPEWLKKTTVLLFLNAAKQVPASPTSGDQPVGSTFNVGFDVFGRVCDVNVETS